MKNLLVLIMALTISSVSIAAENIALSFDRVPVIDLVNAVYGDILKKNYAIDPAVLAKPDLVTVHFTGVDAGHISDYLDTLLDSIGLVAEQKTGHVLIKPKDGESERELFFYRPKHRASSYLTDLVMTLFDRGRFSTQRGIKIGAGSNPANSSAVPVSDYPGAKEKSPASSAGHAGSGGSSSADKSAGMSSPEVDAFIFEGNAKEIARLAKLLAQIDTPAGEVLIKAIVYEVGSSNREGSAAGIAVNILNGKLGLKIGNPAVSDSAISFKAAGIEAVFTALNSDSRFKVVSSPSLRVRSGAHGLVSVGSDYPVPSISYDRTGNPIQTVEYKPSGVILDIKPTVTEERIDLTVNQQISSFVPAAGANGTPILAKREFSTVVGMLPDEIMILGGLDESKTNNDRSGLSFLPSWLHSSGQESSKTEILLVLQVNKI